MPRPPKEEFVIRLQASPDPAWPGVVRLRGFLKVALRMFNLKCTDLRSAAGTPISQEHDDTEPVPEVRT